MARRAAKKTTKNPITVEKTGHPAAFRKMRCPACSLGYAIESNTEKGKYSCQRCGASFGSTQL